MIYHYISLYNQGLESDKDIVFKDGAPIFSIVFNLVDETNALLAALGIDAELEEIVEPTQEQLAAALDFLENG